MIRQLANIIWKFRLHPIRVFVFHQVSDTYNPSLMWECDWTQSNQFKSNILKLKEKYIFISLTEAYEHLKHDIFRRKKYVVLTCDDGYASLKNILPWLEKEGVPITLFINCKYLDGKSWSPLNEELARKNKVEVDMKELVENLYLTKEDLWNMTSPYLTVGLHGYEHLSAVSMSKDEFRESVKLCRSELEQHPRYIPFFAYTWGRHNLNTDNVLDEFGLIKVTVSAQKNYTYNGFIDRECIDGLGL